MRAIGLSLVFLMLLSCFDSRGARGNASRAVTDENAETPHSDFSLRLLSVMRNAELPDALISAIQAASAQDPMFIADLLVCLEGDPALRMLVDKQRPLPPGYVPAGLAVLEDGHYRVTRAGMTLAGIAAESLREMAAAARAEGVVLTVGSAYRSYEYQAEVNARLVRQMGQEAADRVSSRPGHSQHQTGMVIDFSPIDDSFAQTAAGGWVAANASHFGWSLSFPDGYEDVTGYTWESWHYRYVGRDLAAFIDDYFGGIQQYALRFLHEWEIGDWE